MEQLLEDMYSLWVENIPRPGIWALRLDVPIQAVVDDVKDQICHLVNDHTHQLY